MDYKLIWSPPAIEDIKAIAEYIARDSAFYAESTVERIFQAPEKWLQFPKLGRVVPEKNDETIREIFVFQYRILYEIVTYWNTYPYCRTRKKNHWRFDLIPGFRAALYSRARFRSFFSFRSLPPDKQCDTSHPTFLNLSSGSKQS